MIVISVVRFANQFIGALGIFSQPWISGGNLYLWWNKNKTILEFIFFVWLHFRWNIYVYVFLAFNIWKQQKVQQNTSKYIFSKQPNGCFILPFFRWCKEELSQNEELRGEKNDEVEKLQAPNLDQPFF